MTAPALLARLRDRGVTLRVNGTRLAYEAPRGVLTAEDLAALRDRRDELISLLGPPTTPPDWESLSGMRWGEDTSPGIVVPVPEPAPVVTESPGTTAPRTRSWSAPDCPAWVDDESLTVRSADARAAGETERHQPPIKRQPRS